MTLYKTLKIASCAMLFAIAGIAQANDSWELSRHGLDNSKSVLDVTIYSVSPEFYMMAFPGQTIPRRSSKDVFRSGDRMEIYLYNPNDKSVKKKCDSIILPNKWNHTAVVTCQVFGKDVMIKVTPKVPPGGHEVEKQWGYTVTTTTPVQ